MTLILEHPPIPFEHHLLGGFRYGQSIIIRGHADYHKANGMPSFQINLGVDPNHHEHIALHLSPREHPHKVIFNSMIGGEWGHEEHHHNHIHDGEHFEIKIRAHHHHYHIHINGHHVCDFKYRIPGPMVNHLEVVGGVRIDDVIIEQHD